VKEKGVPNATEARLLDIQSRMRNWNDFITALNVPAEFIPGLSTGRIELLKLVQPRAMSIEECRVLYDLIFGLVETNNVLREHAELVAQLADTTHQSLKGAVHAADRIRRFANFMEPVEEGDDQ
jgi:hypothetical protein